MSLPPTVASADPDLGALEAAAGGMLAMCDLLSSDRDWSRRRQRVIDTNPELRERELIKFAAIVVSLTASLRGRSVPDVQAALVAETATAAFRVAFRCWLDGPPERSGSLATTMRDTLRLLPGPVVPS